MTEPFVEISVIAETDIKQEVIEFDDAVEQLATDERKEEFQMKQDPDEREIKYVNTQDYLDISETALSDPNRAAPDVTTSPGEESGATRNDGAIENSWGWSGTNFKISNRVSQDQLDHLLDYLMLRPSMAKGVGLGARSKGTVERQWNCLASTLNALGSGSTKTGDRWKKYWTDIKHKAKTRAALKRKGHNETGGGPPLGETDQKVLAIIGTRAAFGGVQRRAPVFRPLTNAVAVENHVAQVANVVEDHQTPVFVSSQTATQDSQGTEMYVDSEVAIGLEEESPATSANLRPLTTSGQTTRAGTAAVHLYPPSTSGQTVTRAETTVVNSISPSTSGQTITRAGTSGQGGFKKESDNKNPTGKFQCDTCDHQSKRLYDLKRHMSLHTGEEPYRCKVCDYRTINGTNLKNHLRTHSKEKPYKCELCDYRCTQFGSLKCHIRTHSREKPYKCEVCDYRTAQNSTLKCHMRTHSKEKPYKCEVCDYRSAQTSTLKNHMKTHTGEKPHECGICKYRTAQASTLKSHMRTHSIEKPYKCEICDYSAAQSRTLKSHMKIHLTEKPYKCDVCDYQAAQSGSLKIHMKTHSKEKPYKCEVCDNSFTQTSQLKNHMRTHLSEKPHKCEVCDYRAAQSSSLKIHMRTHSKEKPYKCEVCDSRFAQSNQLKVHMRIHTGEQPYECDICDYRSARIGNLNRHIFKHATDKSYKWEVCITNVQPSAT